MGKGPTFGERQRRRVEFPDCGVEVEAVLLLTHFQSHHGVVQGERGGGHPPPPPTPCGGPDLPGILPKTPVAALVLGIGVPWRGVNSDQPMDSLCTPPHAEYSCDPGSG